MPSNKYLGPADRLALYELQVADHPEADLKGATLPYTSRNGHMFSFLDVAGTMALRLPSRDRETFVDRYQSRTAEQHGRPMREYVVIPNDLLERTEELAGWFRLSYESIGTLKPKTTKGR